MATRPVTHAGIRPFQSVRWTIDPGQYKIVQVALRCFKCLINSIVYALNRWVIPPLNRAFYGVVAVSPPRYRVLQKAPTPAAAPAQPAPAVAAPTPVPPSAATKEAARVPTPVPLSEPAAPPAPAPAAVAPPPPLEVLEEKRSVTPKPDSDSGVSSTDENPQQTGTASVGGWSLLGSFLPWGKK